MTLTGFVDASGLALVRIKVRGAAADWQMMSFEIDTEAQPAAITSLRWLEALGAPMEPGSAMVMADGSRAASVLAVIEKEWLSGSQVIEVLAAATPESRTPFREPGQRGAAPNALLGRGLLENCCVTIDYGHKTVSVEQSQGVTQ